MTQPPVSIIALAEAMARQSPCAKSKRGAVVYPPELINRVVGIGFNGQPAPFVCTGTARCRELCRQICEHAEGRAVRQAAGSVFVTSGHADVYGGLDLVHVKIGDDGKLVAGGRPSCWQCSRAILDCEFIAGVWLYERDYDLVTPTPSGETWPALKDASRWRRYSAEEFHRTTLRNCGMLEP